MKPVKYVSKTDEKLEVTATKVEENTTIDHAEYGPILVTPDNYILTFKTGPNKGELVGITENDLKQHYTEA